MRVLFEDFELDLDRQELLRRGSVVPIAPKLFDLLAYLISKRNQVVSKDQLLEQIWKGRFVSESTLNSHINLLRRALDDSGSDQRLIRTVARKGFRFVGSVDEQPAAHSSPSELNPSFQEKPSRYGAPSVAVLPLVDLTPQPQIRFLTFVLVEDVIDFLARSKRVSVVARRSAAVWAQQSIDARALGRELGVRYLVDGSVRQVGSELHLLVHLIDAQTGFHLCTERLGASLAPDGMLQRNTAARIASIVATRIERAELDREIQKPAENPQAHHLYLRGRAAFERGGRSGSTQALQLFAQAVELDPGFAAAYASAAWCYVWRKQTFCLSDHSREGEEGARLGRLATEVDKEDALSMTLGAYALGHSGEDLSTCISIVNRALELNSGVATIWRLSAGQHLSAGLHEEALSLLRQADDLNQSVEEIGQTAILTSLSNLFLGRPDQAISSAEDAFAASPDIPQTAAVLAASHGMAGSTTEAARAMAKLRAEGPDLRVAGVRNWIHLRRAEDLELFSEGLVRAGLPH